MPKYKWEVRDNGGAVVDGLFVVADLTDAMVEELETVIKAAKSRSFFVYDIALDFLDLHFTILYPDGRKEDKADRLMADVGGVERTEAKAALVLDGKEYDVIMDVEHPIQESEQGGKP